MLDNLLLSKTEKILVSRPDCGKKVVAVVKHIHSKEPELCSNRTKLFPS
jgi:hypothetical protein